MIDGRRMGSGNEATVEAALAAGCALFAGYPVTPATEILETAADLFPRHGRQAIPAENEIGAIHMVAGASLAGYRAMTATTGIGFSLMSEALSYFSGMAELPGVVVVQQRWGPGDGSLGPGQDSYKQVTRGAGHGDFRLLVLAPSSAQETVDLTMLAFELADRHAMFAVVLGDQVTAMASELYTVPDPVEPPRRPDAFGPNPATGKEAAGILPEMVAVDSVAGDFAAIERLARRWEAKYERIRAEEARHVLSGDGDGDGDVLVVAYGSLARAVTGALPLLAERGVRAALFRPVTLWPFPERALAEAAEGRRVVVAELSMGQLVDDVVIALGRRPDGFVNWLGGVSPSSEELAGAVAGALGAPAGAAR